MRYHLCLCVRGALKWPKSKLKNMFTKDNGQTATPDEAKEILLDELSKGHEVIPFSQCDNFDFKTGCKGHEDKPDQKGLEEGRKCRG